MGDNWNGLENNLDAKLSLSEHVSGQLGMSIPDSLRLYQRTSPRQQYQYLRGA